MHSSHRLLLGTLLIPHLLHAAAPTILNLLTDDMLLERVALFKKDHGVNAIVKLDIHYLNSDDCQSGYAGFYSTGMSAALPAYNKKTYSLNSASTYQAGIEAVGSYKIDAIHSILIRFFSSQTQLARFTGSCQDQQINCCIPVDCSNQTGTCLAKHDIGMQHFHLSAL